jgi:hypothetical protein
MSDGLAALLERVVAKKAEKDALSKQLKDVDRELDELESLAAEQMSLSGLDGVRAAGRTWWTEEQFYLSVPADNRDKVLKAAEAEGIKDLTTINTSSLKAWLLEKREAGAETIAAGTAFDGLVSEYVKVRLRGRSVS